MASGESAADWDWDDAEWSFPPQVLLLAASLPGKSNRLTADPDPVDSGSFLAIRRMERARRRTMKFFISYAHRNREAVDRLHVHLATLRREGVVTWYDREILAGSDLDADIRANLADSDVFLAIVSADYIASPYCWEEELAEAIRRQSEGTMRVIPIIYEPCLWQRTSLGKLKGIPDDGRPITEWENIERAWTTVMGEIDRVVAAANRPGSRTGQVGTQAAPQLRPVPTAAPRYRVRRDFDELDVSDFREATFITIRDFFETELAELIQEPDLNGKLVRIDDDGFTCTVSNRGLERGVAHLTVYGRRGFGDISFSNSLHASRDTSNGWFSVERHPYSLALKGTFVDFGGDQEELTPEEVARWLWEELLDRAGISIRA